MSSHTKPETDRVFAVIDAKDIHGFIDLLAEDARLFFGNAAPMVGRGGITAGVEEFYATIAAVSHQVVNTWTIAAHTIVHADVTYRRLDGNQVTVPSATIYRTNDAGKIDEYRIFNDMTPVYS